MQRRSFIKGVAAVAAVSAVTPSATFAAGKPKGLNALAFKDALNAITGGKTPTKSGKVKIKAPEIAENGAVVPIKVIVDSPMTSSNYVKAIHVLGTKNGNARCVSIALSPANGKAVFGTRIKLGSTQDIMAVAEMSDGSFLSATANVKVTIGGCG